VDIGAGFGLGSPFFPKFPKLTFDMPTTDLKLMASMEHIGRLTL